MKVVLAQLNSVGDPGLNLQRAKIAVQHAQGVGADLLVLPEAMMCAFGNPLRDVAEPVDGPWVSGLREAAADAGLVAVAGMFTPGAGRAPSKLIRNTTVAVGADVAVHYDKIHLYDAFGFAESDTVQPGAQPVTFEVAGLKVGLATCYDVRFPRLFVHYAELGCDAVALGASWGAGPGKAEQWDLLVRARALDSTCWLFACGQADPLSTRVPAVDGAPTGIGRSAIVAPDGEVRALAGAATEFLLADAGVNEVVSVRERLPVVANQVSGAWHCGPRPGAWR